MPSAGLDSTVSVGAAVIISDGFAAAIVSAGFPPAIASAGFPASILSAGFMAAMVSAGLAGPAMLPPGEAAILSPDASPAVATGVCPE
jgi:hypothetical protein